VTVKTLHPIRPARRVFIGVALAAAVAADAGAQSATPNLTRQERAAMQAVVRAADATGSTVPVADADWPLHVLRASDGSHYVAFSLNNAAGLRLNRPLVLYVRLSTRRRANETMAPERSAVAEWLAGQTPAPVLPQRGLAFGEMPVYGAAGIGQRIAGQQAQNLQVLDLERERAREKREAQERERKASLEGAEHGRPMRALMPFEDFDLRAQAIADSTGAPVLRRSLTAGPGEYELTVAWIETDADPASGVRVARRAVSLPPASTTTFALSSVIVADEVGVRDTPVAPAEQTARPYSIGNTEITPARDHVLTPDERLAFVVQVINARGSPVGKPDVEMTFRVFRKAGAREENVGSLAPQTYNGLTLPVDFDVAKGHPIFAAVAIPLRTFKRGEYRLEIAANDRVAGTGITTDVGFTVATTAPALLREAPPLAPPFQPDKELLSTAVPVIRGAVHASDGHDREAIAVWEAAMNGGADAKVVMPLIIDAWLRLGDTARATELARQALTALPDHPRLTRQLAAAHLRSGRHQEALALLDARLERDANDVDALWLTLHTLFDGFVNQRGPGSTPEGRARIGELATRYAAAKGPNAALALDWAAASR
jgi:hypothetical protein